MADIHCPDCGGTKLHKYGKNKAGLPKYRCVDPECLRQFVYGSNHLIDDKTKAMVKRLLAEKVAPDAIIKALTPDDGVSKPPISRRWIYELRRRMTHDRQHR